MSHKPEDVKAARRAAGMTQRVCAERFGYSLVGWQQKEATGKTMRRLSRGEYELLQLLGDIHPVYRLVKN